MLCVYSLLDNGVPPPNTRKTCRYSTWTGSKLVGLTGVLQLDTCNESVRGDQPNAAQKGQHRCFDRLTDRKLYFDDGAWLTCLDFRRSSQLL